MSTLEVNHALVLLLAILMLYCLDTEGGRLTLDSMKMVACKNKRVCHNGVNFRIVFNGSSIESTGSGTMWGVVTSHQQWTDSFGTWQLGQDLDVGLDSKNLVWEYHLSDKEEFDLLFEQPCMPGKCNPDGDTISFVICPNRNGTRGTRLIPAEYGLSRYTVQNVEKWEANISIESSKINIKWKADSVKHSMEGDKVEVYLETVFHNTTCHKDLENQYYVVESSKNDISFWTSKQYWQDARNNFNISASIYQRDFDCKFQFYGWHVIIPFLGDDQQKYNEFRNYYVGHPLASWPVDQLHIWREEMLDAYFYEVMGLDTNEECIDLTNYPSPLSISDKEEKRHPVDDIYRVTKRNIMDYFQITVDLDYTLLDIIELQRNRPNTTSKTVSVCLDKIWEYYEVPANLEITLSFPINILSPNVSENIIKAVALGLNIGREYVRLDSVHNDTNNITTSQRRLESNTQTLVLGFTIFASTEDEKIIFQTKLEENSTHHDIDAALTDKFPDITNTFVANEMDECEQGTQLVTIAGQRRCQSICAVNHYYDISSSSCKEQIGLVVQRNYLVRSLYFGIGVIAWIITLCLVYGAYKYCFNDNQLQFKMDDKVSE